MAILFHQTCNMGVEHADEGVAEDVTNIVHAAFTALGRNRGGTSASFRVVNGVVVYPHSTIDGPRYGSGYANGVGLEEGGSESQGMDGGELELFHAWEKREIRKSSAFEGHPLVRKLGGFCISARSLDDSEVISRMV